MKPKKRFAASSLPSHLSVSFRLVAAGISISASLSAFATDFTWDGGGGDDNWGTAANWNPDGAPTPSSTNNLIFAGTTRLTPINNYVDGDDFKDITFDSGAGAFTLSNTSSNGIDWFGTILNSGTNTQTIGFRLYQSASNTINANIGNITLNSSALLFRNGQALTLTAASGKTIQIDSVIADGGGGAGSSIAINGAGTTTLTGANTFTSGTTLSTGSILNVNSATAIGTGALVLSGGATIDNTSGAAISLTNSNALTLSGGSLTFTGVASGTTHDLTFGALTISGANRTITVTGAGTTLTTGAVNDASGARQLTKAGAGSLVLSAAAGTWTGGTSLIAGSIGIGNNTALGTGVLELGGTSAITPTIFASGGARTITNNVTLLAVGTGNATISGSNALILNGTLTNSGSNRTLTINNSALTTVGGSVYLSEMTGTGRTLSINGSGNTTISGAIANFNGTGTAGGLTYSGTGTLTLSNANTYTGTTTISSGILNLNNALAAQNSIVSIGVANGLAFNTGITAFTIGGLSGASNEALTNGGAAAVALTVGNNDNTGMTYSGILSGAGSLIKTGTGTQTLSGANTYTGGTTVSVGTLQLTQTTSAAATGTFSLGGGTLAINQAGSNFGYTPTINLTADSTISNIGAGAINTTGTINGNSHVLNANSGATRLYLNGTHNSITQINITAGAVGLDLASAGHESTPVVVSSGASLFVANAANTLASNITLNGGTGFGGTGALALEGGTNQTPVLSGTLTLNSGNSSIGNAGTASATNNISITGLVTGTGSLTKISINKLSLSNAASDYTGTTTVSAGTLNVGTFANVNTVSSIGKGSAGGSSADLVLNGGTLQYTGSAAQSTDRLFSVGSSGGTLDASGSNNANALSFTGTGAMGFNAQTGTRTLTLTGTNTANNTLAAVIGDNTGATSLTKTGAGTWVLTGTNTFTGATTLTAGTLSVADTTYLGGTSANNTIVFNGGTLQVTGTTMTSFGSHARTYNASITAGFDINNAANNFNAGSTAFVSTDTLLKTGAGTLTLGAAANTIPKDRFGR
ncbi:MAG: autotransporter-associated beta strand repeat-containing protein [Luteolibacter sp.]